MDLSGIQIECPSPGCTIFMLEFLLLVYLQSKRTFFDDSTGLKASIYSFFNCPAPPNCGESFCISASFISSSTSNRFYVVYLKFFYVCC